MKAPMDYPTNHGPLEPERLIMKPGAALPPANVNKMVGAVMATGRLSLAAEYAENNMDHHTMAVIRSTANELPPGSEETEKRRSCVRDAERDPASFATTDERLTRCD